MEINPKTICRVAQGLTLEIVDEKVRLQLEDKELVLGLELLAVVSLFRIEISIGEAFKQLGQIFTTPDRWIKASETLHRLYQLGMIRSGEEPPVYDQGTGAFGNLGIHIVMMADHNRVKSYLAAIRQIVTPADVVLDIGTGSGFLAIAAAQAGARQVYAVEKSAIANVAQQMFEHNGVADRITLIRGDSRSITLPEPATVLISEILGKDVFDEQVIEVYRDAQRRLLTPEARLIPETIQLYALIGYLPVEQWPSKILHPNTVEHWIHTYGIDYQPLLDLHSPIFYTYFKNKMMEEITWLTDPIPLGNFDLSQITDLNLPIFETRVDLPPDVPRSQINLMTVYPDVTLTAGVDLRRSLEVTDSTNSWLYPVWLHRHPLTVNPGDSLQIHYAPIQTATVQICG